jgi:hypothetical protein
MLPDLFLVSRREIPTAGIVRRVKQLKVLARLGEKWRFARAQPRAFRHSQQSRHASLPRTLLIELRLARAGAPLPGHRATDAILGQAEEEDEREPSPPSTRSGPLSCRYHKATSRLAACYDSWGPR